MFFNLRSNKTLRSKATFYILAVLVAVLYGWGHVESASAQTEEVNPLSIGDRMPNFALKDFRGKSIVSDELDSGKSIAIIFLGVECPLVKLYSKQLSAYQDEFGRDLQIIGINSNRQDSLIEMAKFAKQNQVAFPMLKDSANRVADAFGATRTPEVFLFDDDRRLCYRGAIDDRYTYGGQKTKADTDFLRDAIVTIQNGEVPAVETTEASGCIIGRVLKADRKSTVTYANQISRIIADRCVQCHRSGEVAPLELTDYDQVVGWAEMIREVVNDRRMPPWHANPKHGTFKNDSSLSAEQLALINQWVKNGAPLGDPSDLPEPKKFVEGWQIGQPDAIVKMTDVPYDVPATGVIPYQYFVVDPGFKEDKWVSAAECRIGNRAVVHHIIVGIEGGKGQAEHGQIKSEWLTATAPGSPPMQLPPGFAKLIPAGSKLVFQMHYTPNGTKQTDISAVGFKFIDPQTVRKTVGTREVINTRFKIPAGADNHKVQARFRFVDDALILSMFPHMHLRGKSFRYVAEYPDGETEILLDIPNYDFNWQNGYAFETPKKIPAGTILRCVAHFDNSDANFANPNPNKSVRWGDQTWEEMMIGYFDMALANQQLNLGTEFRDRK